MVTETQEPGGGRYEERGADAVRLGDVLGELFEKKLSGNYERLAVVADAWEQFVPEGLTDHCRLAGLVSGVLKVVVDSPVYAYELRLCSDELVRHIRQRCPRAGLRELRVVLR
jgi:predicted nucleic acid-binding Zn ribbon protein